MKKLQDFFVLECHIADAQLVLFLYLFHWCWHSFQWICPLKFHPHQILSHFCIIVLWSMYIIRMISISGDVCVRVCASYLSLWRQGCGSKVQSARVGSTSSLRFTHCSSGLTVGSRSFVQDVWEFVWKIAEGRRNPGDDIKTVMCRRGLSSQLTLLFSKAWLLFFSQSSFDINFSIKGLKHWFLWS